MSWAEDEGIDAWEPQEPPEGWDSPAIWLDQHYREIPLNELGTSHLENIIRGGAGWWSQQDKLPALKKELAQRLSKTTSQAEGSQNAKGQQELERGK